MFVKEGKDFIYVCSQKMIDRNSESEAFSNEYLKVSVLYTEDRKTAYYYRITPLKKLNIKVFQKMLVVTIPKSKMQHKVLLNLTMNNLILVQYSAKNTGYLVFGKTSTPNF